MYVAAVRSPFSLSSANKLLTDGHLNITQGITESSCQQPPPAPPASGVYFLCVLLLVGVMFIHVVALCDRSAVWLRDFGSLSAAFITVSPIAFHFSLCTAKAHQHLLTSPSPSLQSGADVHWTKTVLMSSGRPAQRSHSVYPANSVIKILFLPGHLSAHLASFAHLKDWEESLCKVFCRVFLSLLSFHASILCSWWSSALWELNHGHGASWHCK